MNGVPAEHLTDMGIAFKALKVLRVSGCSLSMDQVIQLAGATIQNSSIKSLCLDLSSNQIGVKGAIALADVVKRGTSIEVLNLANNNIKAKGGLAIVDALPTTVVKLVLDRNFDSGGSDNAKVRF
jgi:Ran GTPase-activating protein (RanGAP) involved in mRNA processing and transport